MRQFHRHRRWRKTSAAIGPALAASMVCGAITAASAATVSAEAVARAAKDFLTLCAPCHGTGAAGDGPVARSLKIPPTDLTRLSERAGGAFPSAAIFDKIAGLSMPNAHGSREMPVWGDRFVAQAVGKSTSVAEARAAAARGEERIRALVGYLQALQTGQ